MINTYLNIIVISEWCTFIAAILLLDKRTREWQLFISLLFLVLCVETIGWYMHAKLAIFDNAMPFNMLMIISTLFFMWFFSKAKGLQALKKWIVVSGSVFAVVALINLFFFQGLWVYNSFSESLGDIILSLICFNLLFTLVKNDNDLPLLKLSNFWLAIGLLFFSLSSAVLYNFSYLLREYYMETRIDVGTYVNYALNLILYCCLIIAFICQRKATR